MEKGINIDDFKNLVNQFTVDVVNEYKRELILDGKKATGNLLKNVKPLEVEENGNKIIGRISLPDYWKWVEKGRKPGGKFPPPDKIRKWVDDKPILPREVNGITPSKEQLSFLIGRKIHEKGIKPGNQLSNSIDNVYNKYNKSISDKLEKFIDTNLIIINRTLDGK